MKRPDPRHAWVARVQHDLVKRLLWVARDCRDSGRQPAGGELMATLYDEEGQTVDALALWGMLGEQAPDGLDLTAFGSALEACVDAARRDDLNGVLALESAFSRLKQDVASSLNEPDPTGHA